MLGSEMYYPNKGEQFTAAEIIQMMNYWLHQNGVSQEGYSQLPPALQARFHKRRQGVTREEMVLFAADVPPLKKPNADD